MENWFLIVAAVVIAISIFLSVFGRRLIKSVRQRGIKRTSEIIFFRIKTTILLFFPRTYWGTRVGLCPDKRSLSEQEIEKIYEWSNDPEILRWTAGKPNELSLLKFKKKIKSERWNQHYDTLGLFIMVRPRKIIGKISLFSIDWSTLEGELGIFIDKNFWSQHYGREALALTFKYFFTKTPIMRMYAGTYNDNVRAQRIAEANGFRVVGVAKRFNPLLGEEMDGLLLEITKKDFQQREISS